MPDVFISYATPDLGFARHVADNLRSKGLDVYVAGLTLEPGQDWTDEIHEALRDSEWVIFLASSKAISSPFVLQEVGAAIVAGKTLVPVVWDVDPSNLPGWASRSQALDLRQDKAWEIARKLTELATRIRTTKTRGLLIGTALIGGLFWLFSARSEDG